LVSGEAFGPALEVGIRAQALLRQFVLVPRTVRDAVAQLPEADETAVAVELAFAPPCTILCGDDAVITNQW
jgi:hypothetical protein